MNYLKPLRALCTAEEWEYCRDKLAVFDDVQADRKQLAEVANDPQIVALEKKYVPVLNKEQSQDIKCETLISTVGFRPQPVLLTILCLNPERVFLLHTADSRPMAEQVRDDSDIQSSGLVPNEDVILKTISETNAPRNYDILQQEVLPQGIGRIVVDPTGGRKIMGVSLSAFAFWRRIPMVYLQGKEIKGIVRPFSERLTLVENPYDHFGDPDLSLIEELFDLGNYPAALDVCRRLLNTVRDPTTWSMLSILEELITICRDWDAFLHSHEDKDLEDRRLGTRLDTLQSKLKQLSFQIAEEGQIEANRQFLEVAEETWRPGRNNAEPHRLVDIFMNAERRARLGQYDDAIARLYRCLEMSATIQLMERLEIDSPNKITHGRLADAVGGPDILHEKYHEVRQRELLVSDNALWGLDDQMAFLEIIEPSNPIPAIYRAMREETRAGGSLMDKRNRSILAHGTIPITRQGYRQFKGKIEAIIRNAVGPKNFQDLQQQASHPRLIVRG